MELSVKQKQELSLGMSFQLGQAIELLQYSTYDLHQYIKEQELENPLIELKETYQDNFFDAGLKGKASHTSTHLIDEAKSNEQGLREALFEQAKLLCSEDNEQQLLFYLIHNLNDSGYLCLTDKEPFDETTIEKGVHLLQQIGPIGIGARSLKECLLLQITYNHPEETSAKIIIEQYLEFLADRKWNEIARAMQIPLSEVKRAQDFIKTLNPKPCSGLFDYSIEYVKPDIVVEMKEDKLVYYLNEADLPEIHFKNPYTEFGSNKDETTKYISNRYNHFKWLLQSIEQRRLTILKVVEVLIAKQERFFKEGFQSLMPLTLKDIAIEIGMHESTVSRATMNKVIQTPWGAFDLRLLFTSKLEKADGTSVSQMEVKTILETIIEKENKIKPLSDQQISNWFSNEKGITIARRTISKYRDELNIPPASQRKEIIV
ncbi:RNA polymerase factor sigma-54 [Sporosarcina sp. Sa2YVA2]|uniref:RNA polymerase factor sigma-54 n=1 Tax=Sporosarcina quadrami TaxID=2762234 RepID=A0ABR8UDE0_9BACL|nr:RNA polymerase factor sigma-54 [Sporosarcina quadrami]MBD7986060.1 RNA polymerase factor sigma-54 [Sporosarcina quadrami]